MKHDIYNYIKYIQYKFNDEMNDLEKAILNILIVKYNIDHHDLISDEVIDIIIKKLGVLKND